MSEPAKAKTRQAARAIVENSAGEVLLIRRAHTSRGQGQWCLPGGKVDPGETPEQAVRKELREEVGLEAADLKSLFYIADPDPDAGQPYTTYYFHVKTDAPVRLEQSESSEFRWVPPQEAARLPLVFRNDEALQRWLQEH
jgi:8-oxo-dGTP diphosphatase